MGARRSSLGGEPRHSRGVNYPSSPAETSGAASLLGDFPVGEFIARFWQKRHLFLKGALPGFEPPVGADELAGLSCDEEVESRLIEDAWEFDAEGATVANPWKLRQGPFDEDDFSKLGKKGWTLLVQDVDKFVPEVARLLSLIEFLPRWSIDDVMISCAAPGASVGPHTDRYDVFLLQARGTRRWQVSTQVENAELRSDTDLKVLAHFQAEETFEAQVGDVLYLPPGVAHYGVAGDDCVTYSFGFRAPTEATLLSAFADDLVSRAGETQLKEALSAPAAHPAALSPGLVESARVLLERGLEEMKADSRWLGRMLTAPKPNVARQPLEEPPSGDEILAALAQRESFERDPGSRFLFSAEQGRVFLFVDGEDYELSSFENAIELAVCLSEASAIESSSLELAAPQERAWGDLLASLVGAGALIPCDP